MTGTCDNVVSIEVYIFGTTNPGDEKWVATTCIVSLIDQLNLLMMKHQ